MADEATVSLDLSDESLHLRGYREEGASAPLKENLASAILALAEWKEMAAQGGAFMDPMCGSGTLPLEAALIASNRAPGLLRRHFGFLGWLGHVPGAWKRLLEEARDAEIRDPKKLPPIVGYDQDFRAVRIALANLERAGLRGRVHIEKRELAGCVPVASRSGAGVIAMNPPYGERLGEVEELKPLYRSMGDLFKQKFKGWRGYVFTGSPELAKEVGLKASRRFPLYNGPIECRLLKYELY
jgi:23S rRNA (guanine2445-N2)-methyltransferase / 23S rRNA (guanine2069-N7)-methyltransferase